MDLRQPLQRSPGLVFRDGDVGIAGLLLFSRCRVRDTDRQAHTDQRKHCRDFRFCQLKGAVESACNLPRNSQRIVLAEQRISRRNCRFADDPAVVHVAKIDHARDPPGLRPGRAYQHIVIVRVAIYRSCPQIGASRLNFLFKERKKIPHQRAPRWLFDVMELIANPAGTR